MMPSAVRTFSFLAVLAADLLAQSPDPYWIAEGGSWYAEFGTSVASAGDVDGDGFGDVIIGAAVYSNQFDKAGRALVYMSSSGGLDTNAAWIAEGDRTEAWFGRWVASAGDVNGDGFDDVIVGAPRYDAGGTKAGAVFVYLGSSSGLATSAD